MVFGSLGFTELKIRVSDVKNCVEPARNACFGVAFQKAYQEIVKRIFRSKNFAYLFFLASMNETEIDCNAVW